MIHMASKIEETFLTAYEANTDALFRHILFRIGGDREMAKDLLQDTFCRAWDKVRDGREIENLRAYFYRIAHNLIIDEYGKHKTVSLDAMRENVSGETGDEGELDLPDTSLVDPSSAASVNELQRAINKLPEDSRTVLVMRYIDDLGPNEIADMLEESANVVSVRINRATKELRKILRIETE